MNWIYYLLEANGCLLIFFAFYRLALEKETFYHWNRIYLLSTVCLSFILPLLRISSLRVGHIAIGEGYQNETTTNADAWTFNNYLLAIYMSIALLLLLKFMSELAGIFKTVLTSKIEKLDGCSIIRLPESRMPFSFFQFIFLSDEHRKDEKIVTHELTHAKQFHSADLILLELVHIINWFNPFLIFLKKDLKAIHEYLADEEALKSEEQTGDYALFLIRNSSSDQPNNFTIPMFTQSLLKKRIIMLTKSKSPAAGKLKYGLLLIIAPALVCISSLAFSKSYGFEIKITSISQDSTKARKSRAVQPQSPDTKKAKKKATPATPPKPITVKGKIAPPPPPALPGHKRQKLLFHLLRHLSLPKKQIKLFRKASHYANKISGHKLSQEAQKS